MGKKIKTNALRILDKSKIEYEALNSENIEGLVNGLAIVEKYGKDGSLVFKTLVAHGASKELYVFIIPVLKELDLKKAAHATAEKKIEMLPHKSLNQYTGYVKGGCSPIGMKKLYKTFIDNDASKSDTIIVSGGKVGVQVELKVSALCDVVQGELADLHKE
jgi:Cys-tRNA(Pro)/Cys-tRNA(Cys) deacylase